MSLNNQRTKNSFSPETNSGTCKPQPLAAAFMNIIEVALATRDIEVLRVAQVSKKTGQAVSTLWLATKSKTFPPPIKLSKRSVAWINAEVNAVLAARVLASRSGTEIDMKTFVELLVATRT